MDKKLILAAALACVAGVASAQEDIIRPVQGAKEFGFFGNYTSVGGSNAYSINGSVGYYITNNLVGQASLGFSKVNDSPTATNIFVGARYEFDIQGQLVPYVLAGIYFTDSGNNSDSALRAGGGVNYYVRPNAALFAELTFFKVSGNSDTVTSLDFGLRVFFR
jgi:outer membrane protease